MPWVGRLNRALPLPSRLRCRYAVSTTVGLEMTVWFEWDESKDRANIVKHGVGFDEATKVFRDPDLIIREDRMVAGKERLHAVE